MFQIICFKLFSCSDDSELLLQFKLLLFLKRKFCLKFYLIKIQLLHFDVNIKVFAFIMTKFCYKNAYFSFLSQFFIKSLKS